MIKALTAEKRHEKKRGVKGGGGLEAYIKIGLVKLRGGGGCLCPSSYTLKARNLL